MRSSKLFVVVILGEDVRKEELAFSVSNRLRKWRYRIFINEYVDIHMRELCFELDQEIDQVYIY